MGGIKKKVNFIKLDPGSAYDRTALGATSHPGYLELWVAQHYQGSAGPDTVPFHEGHVHAPDLLQAREAGVPLPGLCVPIHHAHFQPGLFPNRTRTSNGLRAHGKSATLGASPSQTALSPFCPSRHTEKEKRLAMGIPGTGNEDHAHKGWPQLPAAGGPEQACAAAPRFSFPAATGAVRSEDHWRRPPPWLMHDPITLSRETGVPLMAALWPCEPWLAP